MGSLLLAVLVATSGCSWLRKSNELYGGDPALRPLEVPPPLPDASEEVSGSVTASGVVAARQAGAPASNGFRLAGERDAVYADVGTALDAIEGVTIASRAQLLGAYDVSYEGSSFLLRVSEIEGGTYVSAVDPRGVPATGDAPTALVARLAEALGASQP
ncbi:hypothetical protein H4F99_02870 [Lysobacter sp. SG-8]|uniref:Uncharacterized protein n=2 Tax=Marilutibacter penaei TaxID=2759900 RepID=A0A7W3U1V0_9GAMM|nr:hypothetical protein [Lysobacter penaei]